MYLLDTDICIYLINRKYPKLWARVIKEKPDSLAVSTITLAELEFGVSNSLFPEQNRQALYLFMNPFEIIPFESQDAVFYGLIRTLLRKSGNLIGPYDMQIAAQCLARDLTLVTHNTREFGRIPDLPMQDWTIAES